MSNPERVVVALMVFGAGWWGSASWSEAHPPPQPKVVNSLTVGDYEAICDSLREFTEEPESVAGCDYAAERAVDYLLRMSGH